MKFLDKFWKKPKPVMVDSRMEIGGRLFVAQKDFSFECEAFALQHIREAGLHECMVRMGEDAESFATRVLIETIAAGKVFILLGCFWVPDGVEWSPDVANETAEYFKVVRDEGEKALLRSAVAGMLQVFLIGGLTSLRISQSYSGILTSALRPAETVVR